MKALIFDLNKWKNRTKDSHSQFTVWVDRDIVAEVKHYLVQMSVRDGLKRTHFSMAINELLAIGLNLTSQTKGE